MKLLRSPSIGLIGRIVAILLAAVLVEFAISTVLYERASQSSVRDDEARRLAEHLVIARRLVAEAPIDRRAAVADELSTVHYVTGWTRESPPPDEPALAAMRRQVILWEPDLATTPLRLGLVKTGLTSQLAGGLALADGSWLRFRTRQSIGSLDWSRSRIMSAALIAALVIGSGGLLVRSTLRPMQRLARAADDFGTAPPQQLAEDGPIEVRRVIAAFNRLQSRIQRLIGERTEALAAVGHDLRTPLSRLRLRTDAIGDPGLRDAITDDIVEMEAMVSSLLAYLGGEEDPERSVLIDVAVLCATLADDAADRGRQVRYDGPDHCEWVVRPIGLKRALSNLLENALHHADDVRITLRADSQLILAVEDNGPGIPEAALRSVLDPFVRLDTARRRDTIGLGLGLAIVVREVEAQGGRLALANRPTGGLRAEIVLPRAD